MKVDEPEKADDVAEKVELPKTILSDKDVIFLTRQSLLPPSVSKD